VSGYALARHQRSGLARTLLGRVDLALTLLGHIGLALALLGRIALALALLGLLSTSAQAQARAKPGKPKANDPAACPYCRGEPERMRAAGIVSHGGFEFGKSNTAAIDAFFPGVAIHWIESAHFEIGFADAEARADYEDKKAFEAELERLAAVLPDVPTRTRALDPWLRMHLYAQRCEDIYARFLGLMQIEQSVFPDGTKIWQLGSPYWGEGPHVGQKGKFEVLVLPNKSLFSEYLREHFGLTTTSSQRWNLVERDTLSTTIRTDEGRLRSDLALHGHIAFNLAHNLLDGYKHYSYDTPPWLREGLAHVLERQVSPRFNSFDASEGGSASMGGRSDWVPEVRSMIKKGEVPRLAELMNLKTFAEFELRHHYTCWSMVDYMIRVHPAGFACLNAKLHGRKDERGFPDSANLRDVHREALRECLGFTYAAFDEAWAAWALSPASDSKPGDAAAKPVGGVF
jgi:hypothetical protein